MSTFNVNTTTFYAEYMIANGNWTTKTWTISLAREGKQGLIIGPDGKPRCIRLTFDLPIGSYTVNNEGYFTVNSGGWVGFSTSSSGSGTLTPSSDIYTYEKYIGDLPIYSIDSFYYYSRVTFMTGGHDINNMNINKVPAGTQIVCKLKKNYAVQANSWSGTSLSIKPGYIPTKNGDGLGTYTNIYGLKTRDSETWSIQSPLLYNGSSNPTTILNIGDNTRFLRIRISCKSDNQYYDVTPGHSFYITTDSSWTRTGSPASWNYYWTSYIYLYVDGNLVATASGTNNTGTSSTADYPEVYRNSYALNTGAAVGKTWILYAGVA